MLGFTARGPDKYPLPRFDQVQGISGTAPVFNVFIRPVTGSGHLIFLGWLKYGFINYLCLKV
jgi:hypothetical protein